MVLAISKTDSHAISFATGTLTGPVRVSPVDPQAQMSR
jgi:hypothetical protein